MAHIWKAQYNYGGYTANMLKRKYLQPVYPSNNDIWSRNLDINNKNGKGTVCNATWKKTCSTSLIKTGTLTSG